MAGLRVRPVEKKSEMSSDAATAAAAPAAPVVKKSTKSQYKSARLGHKVKSATAAITAANVLPQRKANPTAQHRTSSIVGKTAKRRSTRRSSPTSESEDEAGPTAPSMARPGAGEKHGGYLLPWDDGFEDRYASDHVREEEQLVACVCGEALDDRDEHRRLIMCDHCCTWQHFPCMEIDEEDEPLDYFCHICLPEQHEHLLEKLAHDGRRSASKKSKRPTSKTDPMPKTTGDRTATKIANGTVAGVNGNASGRAGSRKRRSSESSEEILPVSKRARSVQTSSPTATRAMDVTAATSRSSRVLDSDAATASANIKDTRVHKKSKQGSSTDTSRIVVLKVQSRGSTASESPTDERKFVTKKRSSTDATTTISLDWPTSRSPLGSRVKFDDVKSPNRPASAAGRKGAVAEFEAIPVTTARRIQFVEKASSPEHVAAPVARRRTITPSPKPTRAVPAAVSMAPARHYTIEAVVKKPMATPPARTITPTPTPTALQAQLIRRSDSTVPLSEGNHIDLVAITPASQRTIDHARDHHAAPVTAEIDSPLRSESENRTPADEGIKQDGDAAVTTIEKSPLEEQENAGVQADSKPRREQIVEPTPTVPEDPSPKGRSVDTGKVDASSIVSGKRSRKPSAKVLQAMSDLSAMDEPEIDQEAIAAHTRARGRRGSTASVASVMSAPTPTAPRAIAKAKRRSVSPALRMKQSRAQQHDKANSTAATATASTPVAPSNGTASSHSSAQSSNEKRWYQGRLGELDNDPMLDGKRQRKLTFKAAKPTSGGKHATTSNAGGDVADERFATPAKPQHAQSERGSTKVDAV